MKLINSFILIGVSFFILGCLGTPLPAEKAQYEQVVQHSYNKDEAYERSKMWIAKTFNSARAVVEYENKDQGRVIGNGAITYRYGLNTLRAYFSLQIDVKDSRTRLKFFNLRNYVKGASRPILSNHKKNIDKRLKDIVSSYFTYMNREKNNEW